MHPYTTSKKRRLRLFSQLTGWLLRRLENHTCQVFCLGFLLLCSSLLLFHLYNWRLCIFCTLGNEKMLQQTRLALLSQISHVLAVEHIVYQGVPSGKCQRGEFFYLLWNVPIQIFAICYITLDVYNGFRCRKGWHSTLDKKL